MSPRAAPAIAVVGMAARYPGAKSVAAFWENLARGHDAVQEVPAQRWDHAPWYDPDPEALNKSYGRWGGFIEDVDRFDPLFFNISPLEAEWMDPQQRLFLEEAWKALEDAGYAADKLAATRCSIFVGCKEGEYLDDRGGGELHPLTLSGNSVSMLPARLAYLLDLKGATVPVNTACSSSLVAVHLACESLRSGACELAIAGGVALMLTPGTHLLLAKASMLSPTGRCRAFDDAADGIVTGEGVGVVVLKALDRALADGDHVYGVIRASAINQDGRTNGITAPSAPSQTALACEVYEAAGVSPETIGLVEAHGTGTRLGDPIEVHALTDAFRRYTQARGFCALGSVKTNIGHTMEASGIAGLIKIMLCLERRTLVPSLHYRACNRHIDLADSPFVVQTEKRAWPQPAHPRRAALSSFGFSGTNVHLLAEEAPARAQQPLASAAPYVIPFSARSPEALRQRLAELREWLGAHGGACRMQDVAFTMQAGRTHHELRTALIARDAGELEALLAAVLRGEQPAGALSNERGQGAEGQRDPALLAVGNRLLSELAAPGFGEEERARRASVVAALYVKGYALAWELARAPGARRLSLPSYPFARERHWLAAHGASSASRLERAREQRAQPVDARPEQAAARGHEQLLALLRSAVTSLLRLPDDALGLDDELLAVGFSSLLGVRLIQMLREQGLRLEHQELVEAGTLRRLAGVIRGDARAARPDELERRAAPLSPAPAVASERAAQAEPFPLSAGQQGLWLMQQLAPETSAYNVPCVFRVRGELRRDALEAALAQVWERHPMLRARVCASEHGPVQSLHPDAAVPLELHAVDGERGAAELIERLAARPFDLTRGPLARVHLLRGPGQDVRLLLLAHHLVMDGSSLALIARDLELLYRRTCDPAPGAALPEAGSYADFVAWQAHMLASEQGERHRQFWRGRLLPAAPSLLLPTDRARPAVRPLQARLYEAELAGELTQALRALAAREHLYPFSLYLGAFKVLLHRYTQQEDLVVGVPVAGRPGAAFEQVVGHFANLVCVRSNPRGAVRFDTFVRELQARHLEALEHADFPCAEVVREVSGAQGRGRAPLASVQFVLQNWVDASSQRGARGDALLEPLLEHQQQGEFELSLELVELAGRTRLFLKYDPALFDERSIARMASHYRGLLQAVVRAPQQPLEALDFLDPVERYQLHEAWRGADHPFAADRCLHELFEEQVARRPDEVAVIGEGQVLSFAALNERANKLARSLVAAGVGPDSVVPILAERSLGLLVGAFAIMKAGGAYLPIDPRYPAERIAFLLDDSRARVVLTAAVDALPAGWSGSCFDLRDVRVYVGDGANLGRRAAPTNLAYVIYTSGSTGTPKGVMIEHRALVNRLQWMQRRYPIRAGDVILHKTPCTFDVSVWELFWWSLTGACVALLEPGAERDPRAVADAIVRHGATVVHFVPSALGVFLQYLGALRRPAELASLRRVFASGEALSVRQVNDFHALLGRSNGTELVNLYGPTEASIDVSFFDCADRPERARVPIGRPIDNMQLLVLSGALQVQPIGVEGELCIAGVGLARGYLNRPELTAERFIEHPLTAGARLYRTGDRARWLADGDLEYLGRLDQQVKVRGLRVEPGEIEAALRKLPGVTDACVVACPAEQGEGSDRLAAYWVGGPGQDHAPEALRRMLSATLPAYMLPSAFVRVPALPQTAHGKVDVRALPPPDRAAPDAAPAHEAPRQGLEETIANVLGELLGGRAPGRVQNFFDAGCHSLLLAQAAIRLSGALRREVPAVALFEHPTCQALARHLGAPVVGANALEQSATRGRQQRARLAQLSVATRAASPEPG